MEILIDVDQSPQGRLTGSARLLTSLDSLALSGTMGLLASLEELCRRSLPTRRPALSPGHAGTVTES